MKETNIDVGVNSPFDLQQFNKTKASDFQKQLKDIYKAKNKLTFLEINNSIDYDIISINSKRNYAEYSEDKLIYEVVKKPKIEDNKIGDFYEINTGIFVGCLILGNQKLVINSGYNTSFFRLLLRQANNLYVDSNANYDQSSENYDVLNVLEYLFLSTLKNAINFGAPKKYIQKNEKGWNIRGRIDISKYLSTDFYKKDGISYSYRELSFDSDILNILIYAIGLCNKEYINKNFKEIVSFMDEIKGDIHILKPTEIMLSRCMKSPVLSNGLYSKYRKALVYAEMIIKHNNLTPDSKNGKKASGWIVDISELWEEYIYNLLVKNFSDWRISAQENIELYKGAFYERSNFPDIIMEKNGHIVILDAKYKKMDFISKDVDRSDLQQVQSYYGYYSALGKHSIKAVLLVYPAREEPAGNKRTSTSMFGIPGCSTFFDISYIKIGSNNVEQQKNEENFIKRIREMIEN